MTAPPVETWGDLVGGVPRLAIWADQNPGEFYLLMHRHGFTLTMDQWLELLNTLSVEARIAVLDQCVAEGLLARRPFRNGSVEYRLERRKRRSKRLNPAWRQYEQRLQAYASAKAGAEQYPGFFPLPDKPEPPPFPPDHRGDVTYLVGYGRRRGP